MRIRRTLKKRMKNVDALGKGHFYENAEDGQVLFSAGLEKGRLDIYEDRFCFIDNGREFEIFFSDVLNVYSHLRVELFSNASCSGDLDFYVPLDMKCRSMDFSLSLPFVVYSSVMNILVGLREDWIKKYSSDG